MFCLPKIVFKTSFAFVCMATWSTHPYNKEIHSPFFRTCWTASTSGFRAGLSFSASCVKKKKKKKGVGLNSEHRIQQELTDTLQCGNKPRKRMREQQRRQGHPEQPPGRDTQSSNEQCASAKETGNDQSCWNQHDTAKSVRSKGPYST